MPSFYIPLSGLDADSTALNTIANNLSNMNTTGFKAQTTNFSDLFYQEVGTTGSGDEIQAGTGVQVASNSTDFSGGPVSSTGVSTDAAINGSGFFVLDDNGSQLYTRDGNFQTSAAGTLESTEGQPVMGYMALNGVINTGAGLSNITIPTGQVMQPSATTSFSMTQSLDSASPVGMQVPGQVQVFDSLGKAYEATVTYTNLGGNKWSYAVTLPDTLAASAPAASSAATLPVTETLPTATSVPTNTTAAIAATTTPILLTGAPPVWSINNTILAQNNPAMGVPNAPDTTLSYTLAPTGLVNGSSSLTIAIGAKSITLQPSSSDESAQNFAVDINNALVAAGIAVTATGANGAPATGVSGTLSFAGTTASNFTVAGTLQQDVPLSTSNYSFGSYTDPTSGSTTLAKVDPTTSLQISEGLLGPAFVPPFTTPQSVSAYAASLQGELTSAGILDVKVTGVNGVLSITGPSSMSITNTAGGPAFVNQDILGTIVSNSLTRQVATTTTPVNPALPSVAGTPSTDGTTLSAGNSATSALSSPLPATQPPVQAAVTNQKVAISSPSAGTFVYNFAISNGNVATVNAGTNLEFTIPNGGAPITSAFPPISPSEDLTTYASDLSATLAALGGSASVTQAGQITVTGPATMTVVPTSNTIAQDFTANQNQYNFVTSNGAVAAVDKTTNLSFAWTDPNGNPVTTTAPLFGANNSLSVAAYAQALNTSLAQISGASATVSAAGQITISGPSNMTVNAGSVTQDFTGTSIPYNFALTGTVGTNSNLRISGPTISGGTTNTNLPIFTGNPEDASAYANDLNTAITAAGIVGVSVSGSNLTGLLTITGPSGISTTGSIQQDVAMATTNYNFSNSNGSVGLVDPSTSLSITEAGGTPVAAPTFTSSQSVSTYANALQTALTSAGIADVTVTGSDTTGLLSITGPSDLVTSAGTIKGVSFGGKMIQDFNATTTRYDFGTYTDPNTGLTAAGLVGQTTSLKITGINDAGKSVTTAAIAPTNPGGETVTEYAALMTTALANAHITGVTVSANTTTGQLSIVGPSSLTFSGSATQNLLGTTTDYAFQPNATVDPTTNLVITGETLNGTMARLTAPQVSAGETIADYATALTAALTTAGIANVSVAATNGQLAITGANVSTSGSLVQGLADATISYNFGSSATVNPATTLTIVGPTVTGSPATTEATAPSPTAGETVAEYAAAFNQALVSAGIDTGPKGVSVTATGGQLSIVGPADILKVSGSASQDLAATTVSYNFGMSAGIIATVDPKTNLTITGQTANGAASTTVAPTVTLGETLAQYVNALNSALTTAGIAGVAATSTPGGQLSITGANISTAGSVIQDPVGSANANGTLVFGSNGNLVSPSANLTNITFAGLSDSAAPMDMSWNLFGPTGTGEVSQTAGESSQSAQNANGYAAGNYQKFSIGSDGTITATYSNGQNQTVGQIGLATVSNLQGLADVGSTQYRTTTASGAATVGVAGTGGLGTLEGSSLEASNVNISAEFSDLIIAQRAFEANSKAVTTFDTVTQETINMIH